MNGRLGRGIREPADWKGAAFPGRFDHLPPQLSRFPLLGDHLNRSQRTFFYAPIF